MRQKGGRHTYTKTWLMGERTQTEVLAQRATLDFVAAALAKGVSREEKGCEERAAIWTRGWKGMKSDAQR